MNKYVKEFFLRGLIFSGLGPVVFGIIVAIISKTPKAEEITGFDILLGILTTYFIAFFQAGISVILTYDKISKLQQASIQGIVIYTVYLVGYLINSWIPFKALPIIIFTSCFVLGFILIWLIIYLITKKVTDNLNKKLEFIEE